MRRDAFVSRDGVGPGRGTRLLIEFILAGKDARMTSFFILWKGSENIVEGSVRIKFPNICFLVSLCIYIYTHTHIQYIHQV